jgi:hypothetical protein
MLGTQKECTKRNAGKKRLKTVGIAAQNHHKRIRLDAFDLQSIHAACRLTMGSLFESATVISSAVFKVTASQRCLAA